MYINTIGKRKDLKMGVLSFYVSFSDESCDFKGFVL